jgi:serine/threonine protein kinase
MGSSSHQVLRTRVPTCLSGPYRHAFYAEGATAVETLRRRHEFVEHVLRLLVAFMAGQDHRGGPVKGLLKTIGRPSVGAWFNCADGLASRLGADHPVVGPIAGVLRDASGAETAASRAIRELTANRNETAHFREDASRAQLKSLRKPLRALLAALEAFRDIDVFAVGRVDVIERPPRAEVHRLRGLEPHRMPDIEWPSGLCKGEPWMLDGDGNAHSLAPWLLVDWRSVPTSLVLERWDDEGPHYWSERLDKGCAIPDDFVDRLRPEQLTEIREPVHLGLGADILRAPVSPRPELPGLRLERKLGEGASGEVWLAHRDHERVAVKLLKPELTSDHHQRERMRREHEVLRTLNEVGIPRAIDFIDDDEHGPVLVMQYIEGERLDACCARSPMSPDRAQMLVEDLLRTLIATHARGIWHRDIKPQNIVLRHEVPFLLDFGIASVRDAAYLTRTFARMGTLAYAPPEQIHGGEVGAWSDLFSVARVLGFAVTASSDPKRHVDALPSGLLSVYTRATQDRSNDRFASADEMLRVLKSVKTGGAPVHTGMTLAGAWAIGEEVGRPVPQVWAFRAFTESGRQATVLVALGEGEGRLRQAVAALNSGERRALGATTPVRSDGCTWCVLEVETPMVAIQKLFHPRPKPPPRRPTPEAAEAPAPDPPTSSTEKKEEGTNWGTIGLAAGVTALAGLFGAAAAATNLEKQKKKREMRQRRAAQLAARGKKGKDS